MLVNFSGHEVKVQKCFFLVLFRQNRHLKCWPMTQAILSIFCVFSWHLEKCQYKIRSNFTRKSSVKYPFFLLVENTSTHQLQSGVNRKWRRGWIIGLHPQNCLVLQTQQLPMNQKLGQNASFCIFFKKAACSHNIQKSILEFSAKVQMYHTKPSLYAQCSITYSQISFIRHQT